MNRKFVARQILQQGHKVDVYVLCVGGTKFGELHGLGNGAYAFFFNDKPRLVAWTDTDADAFTWSDLKGAMENAKSLWERREASSSSAKRSAKPDDRPDALTPPGGRPDTWVQHFVDGR